MWTDSSLYNTYKDVLRKDRNVVVVYDQLLENKSLSLLLREKAADYGCISTIQFENAFFGSIRNESSMIQLENGEKLEPVQTCVISVPSHAWCLYSVGGRELDVTWIDGKVHDDYHLNSGEILVDERLYKLFNLAEKENRFALRLSAYYGADGSLVEQPFGGEFRVVGTIASEEPLKVQKRKENSDYVSFESKTLPPVALAATDFNSTSHPQLNWYLPTTVFYSTTPERVDSLIRSVGITANIDAAYAAQNRALQTMQNKIELKMIITMTMLIVLGINLYSCFSNALNDRKFEVGVKRAVGASKWHIIKQFLYESLLVMAVNTLASVWLVLTVALTYKVVFEHTPNGVGEYFTYTLTISPYSIGMFALCALTLTVVFSLIFAYKTTQVQIVDYLKAE